MLNSPNPDKDLLIKKEKNIAALNIKLEDTKREL